MLLIPNICVTQHLKNVKIAEILQIGIIAQIFGNQIFFKISS